MIFLHSTTFMHQANSDAEYILRVPPMKPCRPKALVAVVLLPLTIAYSQWFPSNGPKGINVNQFMTYGPLILAATTNGVFASSNEGARWTSTSSGLPSSSILSLAAVRSTILAGTSDQSVYRSTDGGTNWEWSGTGIYSLVFFENNMVRCLVTSGDSVFAGTGGGIFVSTDSGVHWLPASNGLTDKNILALESNGIYLWAGTASGGVFRSTNGGANWSTANDSLSDTYIPTVRQIGPNLFAGTGSAGVFVSSDHGDTWENHSTGLTSLLVRSLVGSGTNVLAGTQGGVFVSSNNGDSWVKAEGIFGRYAASDFCVVGGSTLAGTGSGVMSSSDQGHSWEPMNAGLIRTRASALHICDTSIVAGTEWPGVIVMSGDGSKCEAMDTTAKTFGARAIAGTSNELFAGTWGSGVARSTDGGFVWAFTGSGISSPYINALLANGTTLLAGTLQGVFKTANSGANWTDATSGIGGISVYSFASNGTDVFAGTGSGVFRSTDEGTSWTTFGGGLPPTYVNALIPLDSDLFAGTYSSGVFRWIHGSTDWIPARAGLPDACLVTSFAVSGDALFAGSYNGVFMTTDRGASWSQINEGLSDTTVLSLAVRGSFLVAGTNSRGLFLRHLSEVINSVADGPGTTPADFALLQNYPNPFNPSTVITFDVRQTAHIRIYVTDVLGRDVAVLVNGQFLPGMYRTTFDASGLATGTYFCTMRVRDVTLVRKLLLVR